MVINREWLSGGLKTGDGLMKWVEGSEESGFERNGEVLLGSREVVAIWVFLSWDWLAFFLIQAFVLV